MKEILISNEVPSKNGEKDKERWYIVLVGDDCFIVLIFSTMESKEISPNTSTDVNNGVRLNIFVHKRTYRILLR